MTEKEQIANYKFSLNSCQASNLIDVLQNSHDFMQFIPYNSYFFTKREFLDNLGNSIVINVYRGQEGEELGEVVVTKPALHCVADEIF